METMLRNHQDIATDFRTSTEMQAFAGLLPALRTISGVCLLPLTSAVSNGDAMKIAEFAGGRNDVTSQVQSIVNAEQDGLDGVWFGQVFAAEILTVLALAGDKTSRIELGTSVIP